MKGQEHFLGIVPHPNHEEQPSNTGVSDFFRDDYVESLCHYARAVKQNYLCSIIIIEYNYYLLGALLSVLFL